MKTKHWVIVGAGSIGMWIGSHLVAGGHKVTFVARSRIIERTAQYGVHLTSWQGLDLQLAPEQFNMTESMECLKDADYVVVAVKSKDTYSVADQMASFISPSATIISAQNGINNTVSIQNVLPQHKVYALMVPYNVLPMDYCRYHCGTEGVLVADKELEPLIKYFDSSQLGIEFEQDMQSILWGKLLLNLNNPLNALSGVPLVEELSDRKWRIRLASCMDEALYLLNEIGISPKVHSPIPPSLIPTILRLPTFLFKIVAARMLKMDPLARSSMWEDLQLKRQTEIDFINGEIVRTAESLGLKAPNNAQVVSDIKALEEKFGDEKAEKAA